MSFLSKITQLKILFLIIFVVIISRLFYWQVIKADQFSQLAANQLKSLDKVSARRGQIFSGDGFPLVLNKNSYNLFWEKKDNIEKPDQKEIEKISAVTIDPLKREATESAKKKELEENEIKRISALLEGNFVYRLLAKNLDDEQKKQIEQMQIAGLVFETEEIRSYPEASMAAHLLGFLGLDSQGERVGYFGIEGYYDSQLKGKIGFSKQEKDPFFIPIFTGYSLNSKKQDGWNLKLNVDRSIQYIVEEELEKAIERYSAKAGTVIVADPGTGAILAMASYPSYDMRKYWNYSDKEFKNPAVAETYEPGSTFKVISMSMGIDTEAIEKDTVCDICEGPYMLDKYTIRTWNNKYYPDSVMSDVIVHSDNIGMVFVSQKIKPEDFENYLSSFGFGKKTGIDLQDEVPAPLREVWSYVDRATASFGQGIAVTPIQMVQAVSSIANGGYVIEPRIAGSTLENSGTSRVLSSKKQVISEKTANTITEMMVSAVEKGESKWIKPDGIKVAGKTGTAQIPIQGHYDEDRTIASFVGFAPADDPKLLILTIVNEPASSPWGSETAAPLFFYILKRIMVYQGFSS